MTHRVVNSDAGPIHVFDTALAHVVWRKKHKQDCIAIVRGKFYFQRKDGFEMTVRLTATTSPENQHIVNAANEVAGEVERALTDKAA